MDWNPADYLNFIDSILMFRGVRDTDDAPEIWMDRWLDHIECSTTNSAEAKQHMMLATKMAELIDDRKQWLLEEIEKDLTRAQSNEDSILC